MPSELLWQEIKAFLDSHAELLDDEKHWAAVDDEDLSAQANKNTFQYVTA